MNDKKSMRSEPNGNASHQELSTPPESGQPESVLTSLLALNNWLLAFENRTDGADRRNA